MEKRMGTLGPSVRWDRPECASPSQGRWALRQTQRSPEGPRHLHRIPRLSEAPSLCGLPPRGARLTAGGEGALDKHIFLFATDACVSS